MHIFTPFASPLQTAEAMIKDTHRYNKQIIECQQILDAISGKKKGWANHPVVKMYAGHEKWLRCYTECLYFYKRRDMLMSLMAESACGLISPPFLTTDFCDQHKRRLYTKSPDRYPQFAPLGTSETNWYYVDGQLKKYENGKQI